jgi:tetratricopeptide (TPR) repeat protein
MTLILRAPLRRARRVLAFALASLGFAGCVRTPQAEAKHRMEVADREAEPALLLARARAFAEVGDYTRSEQYIDLARRGGASESLVLPLLLDVCIKDQRYRAAVQHTEEYLRKRPGEYRLRFILATLDLALGELESARGELENVLRTAPEHAEAHYTLAVLLRDELGQPLEADAHFREYLKLAPRGSHNREATDSLLRGVP